MYSKFKTVIDKHVEKNHESIIKKIKDIDPPGKKTINTVQTTETISNEYQSKTFKVNIYNMDIKCSFNGYLLSRFINLSQFN